MINYLYSWIWTNADGPSSHQKKKKQQQQKHEQNSLTMVAQTETDNNIASQLYSGLNL